MNDRVTDSLVNSPEAGAVSPLPVDSATTLSQAQPAIYYATNAEVDAAMEIIFQQHDRLLAELAK